MQQIDKTSESFESWDLLENDNLDLNEMKLRFFDLPHKITVACSQLPEYYKLFFLSYNLQMVIGGLKPMMKLRVPKEQIAIYKSRNLVTSFDMDILGGVLLELFHVRITEKIDEGSEQSHVYLIYNPQTVQDMCAKYPEIKEFKKGDINTWIRENIDNGVDRDFLYGLLYGFPVSAVKQYCQYLTETQCRADTHRMISSYGESYLVWGRHNKRDVFIRESLKKMFFSKLSHDTMHLKLMRDLNSIAQPYREASMESFLTSLSNIQTR